MKHTPFKSAMIFQCVECGTQTIKPMGRCREITMGSTSRRKRRPREGHTEAANGDTIVLADTMTMTIADAAAAEDAAHLQKDKSGLRRSRLRTKFPQLSS